MIIIGVVAFVALLVGIFVWVVLAGVLKVEHDQKSAEKNSEQILDEAFDGRDDVTFKIHMRSLKFEAVVAGAKARGYKLAHQAGNPSQSMTLMFERVNEVGSGS